MPTKRLEKVKFGVLLSEALKDGIPEPLVEILVHIAQEGIATVGIFRRSGNLAEQKAIVKRLVEGKLVNCANCNHYTLTGVIKRFLLKIPEGIFGSEAEASLLEVLDMAEKQDQYDRIQSVLSSLPLPTQQLIVLLFGTWFRTANHVQYSSMSSEALGKSVAGSMFHTCALDQHRAERAARVIRLMIEDFAVASMFGHDNLQYFTEVTGTSLQVKEHFRYEFRYSVDDSDAIDNEKKYFDCFAMYLQLEAKRRGFDIEADGVMEGDTSHSPLLFTSREYSYDATAASVPVSPQPLTAVRDCDDTPAPFRKLAASSSAPDVTKLSSETRHRLSSGVTSFDQVKRRQLVHMKMRANWFYSDSTTSTATTTVEDVSRSQKCPADDGKDVNGNTLSVTHAAEGQGKASADSDLPAGCGASQQPYVYRFVVERVYGRSDNSNSQLADL